MARRRTFRLRPLDEWALDTARHAQGEGVDFTAALQLLIDLGVEAGVEKGYWQPYQAPGVQDRPDPARPPSAGTTAQSSGPQGVVEVETQPRTGIPPAPQPEIQEGNENRNNESPINAIPWDAAFEEPV